MGDEWAAIRIYANWPFLLIFASASQFHVYLPCLGTYVAYCHKCLDCESASRCFQQGEGRRAFSGLRALCNLREPPLTALAAGAAKSLASSRLPSTSLRGSSVVAGDLENYSDIRPDILEMIKEEQKVGQMLGLCSFNFNFKNFICSLLMTAWYIFAMCMCS